MFDLEKQIEGWRKEMCAAGITRPEILNELESHLREDVECAKKSGTVPREAFANAVKHIGQSAALKAEFAKAGEDSFVRERQWMRVYCMTFPILYSAMAAVGLLRLEMSLLQRAAGFTAVAVTCLLIWTTKYYHRFLPPIAGKQRRLMIQAGCNLAWIVPAAAFMNFGLPHFSPTLGQLCVTVLWLMAPTAALGGIGYGLGEAAHRRQYV